MTETRPLRRPGLEAKDIGGETLLYNQEGEEIHVLNDTANFIWQLCDGQHTPQEMVDALLSGYDIPPGMQVAADVERTLQVFRTRNLLADEG